MSSDGRPVAFGYRHLMPENGGRKMTEKSLIIIGAGLAGLSTGCYAQMNGYQSHIFEHHTVPGEVAA